MLASTGTGSSAGRAVHAIVLVLPALKLEQTCLMARLQHCEPAQGDLLWLKSIIGWATHEFPQELQHNPIHVYSEMNPIVFNGGYCQLSGWELQ